MSPDILRSGYSVPHFAEGKTEAQQRGERAGPQSHSLLEAGRAKWKHRSA